MQTTLPNAIPPDEVDRQLARKIREIYVRYGGLTPFFAEISRQATQQKAASRSQSNLKMREYLARRYQVAANIKSGET